MQKALKRLRSKNIHPSTARIKILDYLTNTTSHPTVDMIYNGLLGEIPTLSRTTVYKTMALLIKAGLARQVYGEEKEARYDADVSDHGHFKCTRCGRVYDFTVDLDRLETGGLEGFVVDEKDVIFRGICPRCRSREDG